jgi:hypothetical protein
MALKPVLLAFTKDFPKTSTPTKGDEVTVTANVILFIDEAITGYFNIPEADVTTLPNATRAVIKEFTYKRYSDIADTTGTDITVSSFERGLGGGKKVIKKCVRLPHKTLKTGKGKPRTMSIRFPNFFNIPMISQALGTMLKTNEPSTWKIDRGGSYPFLVQAAGISTYQSGAWLVSTPVTPTNADDAGAVGGVTVVTGKTPKVTP